MDEPKVGMYCDQTWSEVRLLEVQSREQGLKLCIEAKDRDTPGYPWARNNLAYDTAEQAVQAGVDLAGRWMALKKWQVAISDKPREKPENAENSGVEVVTAAPG